MRVEQIVLGGNPKMQHITATPISPGALTIRQNGTLMLGELAIPLTVSLNQEFYTKIYTENTTGSSIVKDFAAMFGEYNESTGEFLMHFGYLGLDVSIGQGSIVTSIPCAADSVGTFDVLGAIGSYEAGTFTIDHALVILNALIVSGVSVVDIDLTL